MPSYYQFSDNSFRTKGFPWVQDYADADQHMQTCSACGANQTCVKGDITVELDVYRGTKWPDALGGAHLLLTLSARVLDAWDIDRLTPLAIGGRVHFTGELPPPLEDVSPPDYYWVDGSRMVGAELDLAASGFVITSHCAACGGYDEDVSATYKLHNLGRAPWTFVDNAFTHIDLFTTSFSPRLFFCSLNVLEFARRHRFTNFRFTPIEAGAASWSRGVDYLGRKWPVHHPLRPSEGKTLQEWLSDLSVPKKQYNARVAILDLREEAASAMPELIRLAQSGADGAIRGEATILIAGLRKYGVDVGPAGNAIADQHDENFLKTLGRPMGE
jgi:hypothetical protein